MFRKEGPLRSDRDNRRLAAYLAWIAGMVNSAGFVLVGLFTSHVTGNVGRLADSCVFGHGSEAIGCVILIGSYFVGSFSTSMAIESQAFGGMARTSAALLLAEAALVTLFIVTAGGPGASSVGLGQFEVGALLCIAMGIQNGLVTRLSGAIVRTTHLTGVLTDLGIEAARWVRYSRHRLPQRDGSTAKVTKPHVQKVTLLATILSAFLGGSVCGATLAAKLGRFSLLPAVVVLLIGATYALWSGRSIMGRRDSVRPRT